MLQEISNIVKRARERGGRTLGDLARDSTVPLGVLEALEDGRMGITTRQLDELARALALDSAALLNGREVARTVPSVFLRHQGMQDFDEIDSGSLDRALEQGRSLTALGQALGEPPPVLQTGTFRHRDAAADHQEAPAKEGYRLAGEVRRWLGNTSDPLADVRELLERRCGVAVLVSPLQTARTTAVGVRGDGSAAVVLNDRDLQRASNPLLTRVYLMHELCHIMFDPSLGGVHIVIDSGDDHKAHAAEQRARAFAAEMLLPLDGLVRLLGDPRGVSETARAADLVARSRSRFGTPHEIAVNHLCNLNFVDIRLREWLEATRTTYGASPPSTSLPASCGPSILLREYVERSHREGILTDEEALTTLGMDRLAPLPWDEVSL